MDSNAGTAGRIEVLSNAGQLLDVTVAAADPPGDVVVTLRGTADAVHRTALNLIESDRLSFRLIGEQITQALTSIAAARPDNAVAIGTCGACCHSIFDDESWGNVDVPGGVPAMYHVECVIELSPTYHHA